jgi:hypothetical protein
MRIRLVALTLVVSSLLICTSTLGQSSSWLIFGTVSWSTGTAAASVKIRLLHGAKEKAVVYTNQQGRYGFLDVPGQPSDYTLEIWFGNRLLRTFSPQDMQLIRRGECLDIPLHR